MASGIFTPYSTGAEFFGAKPTWIQDELDILRIQSYQTYEKMYWNVPDIFKVALRGSNSQPIYIPSARTIVDTTNRYVGADIKVVCRGEGDTTTVQAAQLAVNDLVKRERYKTKFGGKKRYGLIWGDSIWHLTADKNKPVGTRLRITSLDPGMYFPIADPDDVDRTIGCHLVEEISTSDGPRIQRLTYRKTENGKISVEMGIFKVDAWEALDDRPERILMPLTDLPDPITSIPVYHTKNSEQPGDPFGSSEVRGLERIMSAVNQTMSDEDLALALMGIGMYATDSDEPTDEKGNRLPWKLGPGRVVHYNGTKWEKVPGAQGIGEAYGEHYNRLWEALFRVSSTPEVAVGMVDVSVASSGIALALQLGPMLSKAGEKNQLLLDVENNFWYDIVRMWFPAFEESTFEGVEVECFVGDAVPVDRVARFAELNDMLDRGVIDTAYYRAEAMKLGYAFPGDIAATAASEFERRQAMSDGFADRVDEEIESGGSTA